MAHPFSRTFPNFESWLAAQPSGRSLRCPDKLELTLVIPRPH